MDNERWRPISGYVGWYEVSNLGRVRRVGACPGARPGHILKPRNDRKGYQNVVLCVNGNTKKHQIHRLVAKEFLEQSDEELQVNHKSGDKTDNRAVNLEWVTQSENALHAIHVLGVSKPFQVGQNNNSAKLTDSDIGKIQHLLRAGYSQSTIAAQFGVTQPTISNIANGKRWKHVTSQFNGEVKTP